MFEGPKVKIKRAYRHIDELESLLADFLARDFFTITVEKDKTSDRYHVKAVQTRDFPEEIPAIIGDAIHNLRAALDLLLFEMIENTGQKPGKAYFPFAKTKDDVAGLIKGGQVSTLGQDIIDVILNGIKPFDRPEGITLYALNRLDIGDKHHLLIPTARPITLSGVSARFGPINMTDCSFGIGDKGEMTIIQGMPPGPIEVRSYGKATFKILFSKGQPLADEEVIPTLRQLAELVTGAVRLLEEAYLARSG